MSLKRHNINKKQRLIVVPDDKDPDYAAIKQLGNFSDNPKKKPTQDPKTPEIERYLRPGSANAYVSKLNENIAHFTNKLDQMKDCTTEICRLNDELDFTKEALQNMRTNFNREKNEKIKLQDELENLQKIHETFTEEATKAQTKDANEIRDLKIRLTAAENVLDQLKDGALDYMKRFKPKEDNIISEEDPKRIKFAKKNEYDQTVNYLNGFSNENPFESPDQELESLKARTSPDL